ncbi:hypothetical protein HYW32_00720 [Candidatus Berkelbacteria bacterium]|nr:hypothetical protein [Candidatus Berkelbacteria bacterium]
MHLIKFLALSLTVLSVFGSSQVNAQSAPKPPRFSAELVQCLKEKLGSAYVEISSGDREPTEDEFEKGEPCFEEFGPKQDPNQVKPEDLNFAPGTEKCLKEKLGENFKDEFIGTKSKEQAKTFRAKTRDCFGKNVAGNKPPELPVDVKTCIIETVGQTAATAMFQGQPLAEDSELRKKIEGAKCFKNFGPPKSPGHDRPELSADKKACVEKIMGQSFDNVQSEPTEEQKQRIGKECFGGQGKPGGPDGPDNQLPAEVQSCLEGAFGNQLDDLKKGPEFLIDEQKQKVEGCFNKHGFRPGGQDGKNRIPDGPELSDDKRKCVEGVLGGDFKSKEPSEEQKRELGQKCFEDNGSKGPNIQKTEPGVNLPPDKRACVERIMGSADKEPTEEQKQLVGRECFGGQDHPNTQEQPNKPPPGEFIPQVSRPKNECVDRIVGNQPPTPEQQQQIERECFNGQAQVPLQSPAMSAPPLIPDTLESNNSVSPPLQISPPVEKKDLEETSSQR